MPVPGKETVPSPKLEKIEMPKVLSHLDQKSENDQAENELDVAVKGIHDKVGQHRTSDEKENPFVGKKIPKIEKVKTKKSRLKSLRKSTSGIETQVSVMNKKVERYAGGENETDV